MKPIAHILTFACAFAVLVGVPFAAFANIDAIRAAASGVDTVSSATTIQDAPSGRYTIYINRAKHANADVLENWVTFFSGSEVPLIMEDVDCTVLAGDVSGLDMATSLQSRLPENQMKVAVADPVLALSKADAGLFDVLVLSDEMAQAYSAETVESSQDVEVVRR